MTRFSALLLLCVACEEGASMQQVAPEEAAANTEAGLGDAHGDTIASAYAVELPLLGPGETEVIELEGRFEATTDAEVFAITGPEGTRMDVDARMVGLMENKQRVEGTWYTTRGYMSWFGPDTTHYVRLRPSVGWRGPWELSIEVYQPFDAPSNDWASYLDDAVQLPTWGTGLSTYLEPGDFEVYTFQTTGGLRVETTGLLNTSCLLLAQDGAVLDYVNDGGLDHNCAIDIDQPGTYGLVVHHWGEHEPTTVTPYAMRGEVGVSASAR